MRVWLALRLAIALALASVGPAMANEMPAEETTDGDVYSASEALAAEGYTWDEAEGFFVATEFVAEGDAPADTPKPRLDPNGCGPGWLPDAVEGSGDNPGGFAFKDACDAHDKCYSTHPLPKPHTADTWRKKCDDDFEAALTKYCDSVQGAKIADKYKLVFKDGKVTWEKTGEIKWDDEAAKKHCKFWRDAYVKAVRSKLGTDAFNKAQEAAKKKAEEKPPGEGDPTTPTYEPAPTYEPTAPTYGTTYPAPVSP